MAKTLSLSLGEFFAEASLGEGQEFQSHRWPLSKNSLEKGLSQFLESTDRAEIAHVQVNLPLLESLLRKRLGNTPAFLTTEGFENWLEMNLPVEPEHFSLHPRRVLSPLDADLTFGISERVNARGEILKKFEPSELEFLGTKLQMNEVKWVALGLLHADKNPMHEKTMAEALQKMGFQVVTSHPFQSDSERPRWWAAVLTAYLAPLIEDWKNEILRVLNVLEISAAPEFWTSQGLKKDWSLEESLLLLFGSAAIFKRWGQRQKTHSGLFLDLEGFYFQDFQANENVWSSDLGPVAVSAPPRKKLKIQPTSSLLPSWLGGVEVSSQELGFEPGPMSLGRGLNPCFLDCLTLLHPDQPIPGYGEYVQSKSFSRIEESLSTLLRNFSSEENLQPRELTQTLWNQGTKSLLQEVLFQGHTDLSIAGVFSPLFFEALKGHPSTSQLNVKSSPLLLTQMALEGG